MGRRPCCDKNEVKKGQWSGEEDQILVDYIKEHGHGSWRTLPKNAGLLRCGKSCRLRWTNYLRPSIKRGPFTPEEEATIIRLHGTLGNKWAAIASQIPGRTDNEVKNFWNTHLKKRLSSMAQKLPIRHSFSTLQPADLKDESPSTRHMAQWENARVEAEARLSMESLLLNPPSSVKVEYDHFLRLWNSEVGESFRKRIGKCGRQCESPVCQTSISAILSSDSVDSKGSAMAKTSTSNDARSNEFTDSSETELKLLLDSSGGNDMEFTQGKIEVVSEFLLSSCYEGYRDKS